MNRLLAFLSWPALILLPTAGFSLGDLWGAAGGAAIGFAFFVWAHDWEVRELNNRPRDPL